MQPLAKTAVKSGTISLAVGRIVTNSVAPVRIWIAQLKEGDPVAAPQLWDLDFGRMVKAARLKRHGAPGRMADEEDVALSAF